MRVKTRLILMVATGIAGVLITFIIGYVTSNRDEYALRDIYENRLESIKLMMELEISFSEMIKRDYQIMALSLLSDKEQTLEVPKSFAAHSLEFKRAPEILKKYSAIEMSPEAAEKAWPEFKKAWDEWYEIETRASQYISARLANPTQESLRDMYAYLIKINVDRRDLSNKLGELTSALTDIDLKQAQSHYEEAIYDSQAMMNIQLIALVLIIIAIMTLAWSIFRSVVAPIARTRDLVVRIESEQDLGLRMNYASKDEIGEMVGAFNKMLDKIQSSVISVQASVDQVNKEVDSLNEAAGAVARGSQAQSASTSSVAASVEQMTVSISSVSNSASDAQALAQSAGEISDEGSKTIVRTADEMRSMVEIVAQTSSVIQALGEESRQISTVVQVIKDVADQTNLLALNAAIEAARAGDQGRGFAVVADEVRKLAERTAKSIDDITAMINKIQASANEAVEEMDKVVRQVEQGQRLTQEAGDKMHIISDQAQKVLSAIDEISNALKEQSVASQDIAKNVENIAQMTDKNNESADSAAKGANKLTQLSKEVRSTLSQFKVRQQYTATPHKKAVAT